MKIAIGTRVKYTNGNLNIQDGFVIRINGDELIVLNNDLASLELYKAGIKIGDCIKKSQIKG